MGVTRKNVVTDNPARKAYIDGVLALKTEFTPGATSTTFGLAGPAQPLSTWDLFVLWHGRAAAIENDTGRGKIHRGPVFLPWHRWMLLLLEANIARVLNMSSFALPYWDWSVDGARPANTQSQSPIFGAGMFGGGTGGPPQGTSVPDGPFGVGGGFTVRVLDGPNGPRSVSQPLTRSIGEGAPLPTRANVTAILAITPYDMAPFDSRSGTGGMRNKLEGWAPPGGPHAHNQVHVFVGGDMGFGTSPNDPLFYLHHANIDRIWAAWQKKHALLASGVRYPTTATVPQGHRLTDPLYSALTSRLPGNPAPPIARQMLNVQTLYTYDALPT
jgi:tyrosinase